MLRGRLTTWASIRQGSRSVPGMNGSPPPTPLPRPQTWPSSTVPTPNVPTAPPARPSRTPPPPESAVGLAWGKGQLLSHELPGDSTWEQGWEPLHSRELTPYTTCLSRSRPPGHIPRHLSLSSLPRVSEWNAPGGGFHIVPPVRPCFSVVSNDTLSSSKSWTCLHPHTGAGLQGAQPVTARTVHGQGGPRT